jgi:hypothetical protein
MSDQDDPHHLDKQIKELERRLSDLKRRKAQQSGIPTHKKQTVSSRVTRQVRLVRWLITCDLCERKEVIATRYPGQPPTICDECYAQFEGSDDARHKAYEARKARKKEGKTLDKDAPKRLDE